MHRMFVVSTVHFRPSSDDVSPMSVRQLGFSTVQLMRLSGLNATGVRADLEITDPEVLDTLETYHAEQTELEWSFEFGGGARGITVPLRWTRFTRRTGHVQVVRNVVMRDLIAEVEGTDDTASQDLPPTPKSASSDRPPEPADASTASSSTSTETKSLWPRVLGGTILDRFRSSNGGTP